MPEQNQGSIVSQKVSILLNNTGPGLNAYLMLAVTEPQTVAESWTVTAKLPTNFPIVV